MSFLSYLAQTYDYTVGSSEELLAETASTETAVNAGPFLIALLIVFLVGYALSAWLLGRIFKKAGIAQWKAWVPFYNMWITLELGNQKGWWTIIVLIPILNIVPTVIFYIASYHIGLKLGKSGAFVLWAIFFPAVWYIWLAFDDSTWESATPELTTPPTPAFAPPANPTV